VAQDWLGNPVSSAQPATRRALDDFSHGFLSYETSAVNVLSAAEADPSDCLANVYAGMIWMFLEALDAPEKAAMFIQRARAAAKTALFREVGALCVLESWAAGDARAAQRHAQGVLAEHPRDLALLKLHQYFSFNRGDAPAMLRIALQSETAAADIAYWHGMAAFAYEQCHLLTDAEASANRALAIQPKEPWAHHALAHVMLTQGRIEEGAAFLSEVSATWTNLNSFMHTHNWWHLALFRLSQGRFADALALYDREVWGVDPSYSQDQVGAVALLTRLELAGVDVAGRWADVALQLAVRHSDTVEPFLTLQYLYGLAKAGRAEAAQLYAAIQTAAARAPDDRRAAWADVALPAADGLLAHAHGDFEVAVRRLGEALPRMAEIGGSHAQRDLFQLIHLDALIRSGRLISAQQALEERRRFDPDGVVVNRDLARVYAALDLPKQAEVASARAAARLKVVL
jgi:predicted Zn-dependent protease